MKISKAINFLEGPTNSIITEDLQFFIENGQTDINISGSTIFTRPNLNLKTKVGNVNVLIHGTTATNSIIKRPNNAIGKNWSSTDFNYGIYFSPDNPTAQELEQAQWYDDGDGQGLYTIIIRGNITFRNLTIDCNMGNQDKVYPGMPGTDIEHSSMIGFSGRLYNVVFQGTPRRVFVGFNSVNFENVRLINGGYADDIWCSRGYFKPNVEEVNCTNVVNVSRINNKRASISFSGLANTINIENCNLYSLESESDNWDNYPPISDSVPIGLNILNLTTQRLDWATKSKASNVFANNIICTEYSYFYQCGGLIQNSTLIVSPADGRFHRLNGMEFRDCQWENHSVDVNGNLRSICPFTQFGDSCQVTFTRVNFTCNLSSIKSTDYLIITDETNNATVTANFIDCVYDARFVSQNRVARLRNIGTYVFNGAQVNTSNITKAGAYTSQITLQIN